jgi:hypothetical protein
MTDLVNQLKALRIVMMGQKKQTTNKDASIASAVYDHLSNLLKAVVNEDDDDNAQEANV